MNEITSMEAGKLCEMRRERASGPPRIYHNHQYWKDGRNHSSYVGADQVEALREGIEGRRRFEQLAHEFVEITVAQTREARAESKKNSAGRLRTRNTAKRKVS